MIPLVFLSVLINQPIYEMEEIVVTATRYPVALQDIVVATMVIEKQTIDVLYPLGLGELLHASSGIDFKEYGTPGAVSSVSLRGLPSNGTLVLLNGQPLNATTTGMADLSLIDIHSIERIEIVKGPVASLYGANALGGVINCITTRHLERPDIRFIVMPSTTTFDFLTQTNDLALKAGIPLGRLQVDVSGAFRSSEGLRGNSNLTKYDGQGLFEYRASTWTAYASILYDEKDYGIPGPVPLIDSIHPVPIFGDSTATSLYDHEKDRTLLGSFFLTWKPSDLIQWKNVLYADRKQTEFHTQYAGWLGDTIIEDHDYLTYTIGYNTMVLLRYRDVDFTLGFDMHYDSVRTTRTSEQSGDTTWNAQSYTLGAWFQLKKDFSRIISVVPSLRFDQNKDFGGFISPSIGFVSTLQQNLCVKVSVGRTFRAPTFNDLYWPHSGNRDLTPEYGWAYEFRVETTPVPEVFGAVSLFIRNVEDRIFWLPDTGNLWKPQNVNYLAINGMDIEVHSQIGGFLDLSFEGTYLEATQRHDEIVYDFYDWIADTGVIVLQEIERDAAFVPRYCLRVGQHFCLPYAIGLTLHESYVAQRRNYYGNYDNYPVVTMDEKILEGYTLLNAAVSKEFTQYLTLTIGVKNLLNIEYAQQFGHTYEDLDYPMPGRVYFMKLGAHY